MKYVLLALVIVTLGGVALYSATRPDAADGSSASTASPTPSPTVSAQPEEVSEEAAT